MKRLILIMLTVLATTAVAYRLPTAWSLGGGLSYDSVRVTVFRGEAGSATLTNEVDTSFVGAGTNGTFAIFVDSMVNYTVRYMYFSGTDTFREFSYGNTPVDYEKFSRASILAVRDSMDEAAQVGPGSSGGGCPDSVGNAWTIVAWDSVNNVAVPTSIVTLKSTASSVTPLAQAKSGFTFTAANGTYYVAVQANNVTFPLRSFAVSTSRTDTINGGGLTVLSPSAPNLCAIQGYIKDLNNNPIAGALVTFSLSSSLDTLRYGGSEYTTGSKQVYTSATGYFSTELVPNVLLDANSYYIYKVAKSGVAGLPKERKVIIPNQGSANIDDL